MMAISEVGHRWLTIDPVVEDPPPFNVKLLCKLFDVNDGEWRIGTAKVG
ncbi:hypothetical protein [Aeoliella sp.]